MSNISAMDPYLLLTCYAFDPPRDVSCIIETPYFPTKLIKMGTFTNNLV